MSPRNLIGESTEIIGSLYKGAHSEGFVKRIKPLHPQSAEEFPVIFKIILGSRSRSLVGTKGVGDFQIRYSDSRIHFPIVKSIPQL